MAEFLPNDCLPPQFPFFHFPYHFHIVTHFERQKHDFAELQTTDSTIIKREYTTLLIMNSRRTEIDTNITNRQKRYELRAENAEKSTPHFYDFMRRYVGQNDIFF